MTIQYFPCLQRTKCLNSRLQELFPAIFCFLWKVVFITWNKNVNKDIPLSLLHSMTPQHVWNYIRFLKYISLAYFKMKLIQMLWWCWKRWLMSRPWSDEYYTMLRITYFQFRHLATSLHLWQLQHCGTTWTQSVPFPISFHEAKTMGKSGFA